MDTNSAKFRGFPNELQNSKSLNDLKAVNEACFGNTKKLSPGFYSMCFKYLSDKYGVQSIEAINNLNKKLWPGAKILATHKLSEEMLQKVMSELPAQPWPSKIHQRVANTLGVKEIVVSNAIAYLIYTNKLNAQIYGYIFDSDDNLILEGEHFGHTEEDARLKLKEQRESYERKFQF